MKHILHSFALALLLLASPLPTLAGEIIDGVVASVNRHAVLRSDWEQAVAFEAFMQQKPVAQVTRRERTLALLRLIDRQLLVSQMGDPRAMQPTDSKLLEDVGKLRAQVPNGNDDAAWERLLAGYGLDDGSLQQHLREEVQVMNFIEVRLRPNVHITDDDVVAYYRNQLIPDLQKTGGNVMPLEEVKSRIHELLTQQRIDELLDAWLHNLRQQADIHSTITIPGLNAPESGADVSGSN